MRTLRILLFGLVSMLLALAGCGGDDPVDTGEVPSEADVYFNLNVDGTPLQRNSLIYSSPAGTKFEIRELKFIISDLVLHSEEGKNVLIKSVHYYDIAELSTQSIHVSGLPHANYTSVSFTFGLDASKNVRNKYPAIPLIMVWPEELGKELGYHYMQIEGNYEQTPGGATAGYLTHTGPRHLDGTNIQYPGVVDAQAYHFSFPVSASFTPAHIHEGGHGALEISFNINGWYLDHTPADGNDTAVDFKTMPANIMGNLDFQGKLQTNGPGCFSATLEVHGGHDH